MNKQWISMEHYRLHAIETWPAGPYRNAALAAVQSKLLSLLAELPGSVGAPECSVCAGRRTPVELVSVSRATQIDSKRDILAA
jgi:hypothetical protein